MLERVWRKGKLLTLLVGVYIERATIENSMQVLKRLKIELPYDPAISLLGTNSEETIIQKHTCTQMFVDASALFTIARTWKQPKCPVTE